MMTPRQTRVQRAELDTAHFDFQKGLNTHAFFKVHDHDLGQDLVQDTFLKTWVYLVKGGKVDTMKAFLYHVLNHLIVDEYRKHKPVSLDNLLEGGFEPSVDHSERLLDKLDGKEAMLLLEKLPPTYRKVMRMRYVQDLSLKEMSLLTG